jgi:hypothetical protein
LQRALRPCWVVRSGAWCWTIGPTP